MSKIISIYLNESMSQGHPMLYERIGEKLKDGGYAVFINKAWTALKMLTPANTVLHYKSPKNRPIVPDTIKFMPHCVEGGTLNYNKALEAVVTSAYKKRFGKNATF